MVDDDTSESILSGTVPRKPPTSPVDAPTAAQRVVAGLSKVALVFRHAQWAASGERGLTPTQAQILAVVAGNREPRGVGVKAVAARMAVTMGTASEAVGALVEKGLLRKEPDQSDGRADVLTLTARGKREVSRNSTRVLRVWVISGGVAAADDGAEAARRLESARASERIGCGLGVMRTASDG